MNKERNREERRNKVTIPSAQPPECELAVVQGQKGIGLAKFRAIKFVFVRFVVTIVDLRVVYLNCFTELVSHNCCSSLLLIYLFYSTSYNKQ